MVRCSATHTPLLTEQEKTLEKMFTLNNEGLVWTFFRACFLSRWRYTPLRRSQEEARRGMLIAQRRWMGSDPGLAPCLSFWSGAWGEAFPPMMKNCLTVFFLRAFSRPGDLLLASRAAFALWVGSNLIGLKVFSSAWYSFLRCMLSGPFVLWHQASSSPPIDQDSKTPH
jgi:hypothetical protein